MKSLFFFLLLSSTLTMFGQTKSNFEMQYLHAKRPYFSQYDPAFKTYDFTNTEVNLRLKEAIQFQQKSNNKNGLGAGLAIAGSALMIAGILYTPKTGLDGLFDFTKPFLMTAGAIPMVASVPCFIAAGKNKDRMKMKMAEASSLLIE